MFYGEGPSDEAVGSYLSQRNVADAAAAYERMCGARRDEGEGKPAKRVKATAENRIAIPNMRITANMATAATSSVSERASFDDCDDGDDGGDLFGRKAVPPSSLVVPRKKYGRFFRMLSSRRSEFRTPAIAVALPDDELPRVSAREELAFLAGRVGALAAADLLSPKELFAALKETGGVTKLATLSGAAFYLRVDSDVIYVSGKRDMSAKRRCHVIKDPEFPGFIFLGAA